MTASGADGPASARVPGRFRTRAGRAGQKAPMALSASTDLEGDGREAAQSVHVGSRLDRPAEASPVPLLHVELLGGLRVQRADRAHPVSGWHRSSAKTVVKLLATHPGHALHREQIMDLLWPGWDVESALNSFGKALHAARHALEPELPPRKASSYLDMTDALVVLRAEHAMIDVDRFEALADEALRQGDVASYEAALSSYPGELLPEDRYADWCSERRRFLAELHARLLLGLAEVLERQGAFNEAADRLQRVLAQDATREVAHRRLMRLYAQMGMRDLAVRQFERCKVALGGLDLTAQQETVALYRHILAGSLAPLQPRPDAEPGRRRPGSQRAVGQSSARPSFLGRDHLVQHMWEQVVRGDGSGVGMVIVSGESGIGKTRLLRELTAEAARRGAAVLQGGGGAQGRRFALGPFATALESYVAGRPEAERLHLADRHPRLRAFVPSLELEGARSEATTGQGAARCEIRSGIVQLLSDLSRRRPVLFVVDDLNEVDPFSLDLLCYLAHLAPQRPWLFVGALRSDEVGDRLRLAHITDAATRGHPFEAIELPGLSRPECDELVRALLGSSIVDQRRLGEIYADSRGNPLLVEHLVRWSLVRPADDPDDPQTASPAAVPRRVRELVARRLVAMDDSLRSLLGLTAAIGPRGASLGELRAAAAELRPPLLDATLDDAIERAIHLDLLEERAGGYGLRSSLLQAALARR